MSSYSWPESGGSGGGVTSLNTLTGDVILSAGSNITLTPSGNTITIAATAANPFDQSLNTTDSPTFNALTLTTPLSIANGGTGQVTAALAINALLPSQTGNNGKFLTTDGSVASWSTVANGVAIGATVTGGTAGSTLFVDGSGDLAQDNANYFWDGTNHRLGIGNAVPLSLLSLGKAPSANIYPSLSASADPLLISNEAGQTRIRIGSAGSDISGASCHIRLVRALGTLASPTSVSSASAIGSLNFQGYDGTTVVDGAVISGVVAGSVSSGVVPADLIFSNNNAGVLAENFRIKSTGVLNIKAFNAAGIVHNDSSGNLTSSAIVNADISASAAVDYSKLAALSTGQVLLGNAGVPTATALSGDVTVGATGVTAIGAGKVTNAMLAGSIDLTTKVTGSLPIANGGTGQTAKTAAFDALQPMTTGGDIIYGGASGTGTRLANGSSGQYLKSAGGTSAPAWTAFKVPTVQTFSSSSGTYTTPTSPSPIYLKVRLVGGGGGGGGSGTGAGTNATAGGNTTFGSSLLTANGGGLGQLANGGGTGGSVTVAGPAVGLVSIAGADGQGGQNQTATSTKVNGGSGGSTSFGGGGAGGAGAGGGIAAVANSGSGGGGGGAPAATGAASGSGGGAGGYIEAIISAPSATYAYAVGSAGAAGGAGASGSTGGAGAAGYIVVEEFYQ